MPVTPARIERLTAPHVPADLLSPIEAIFWETTHRIPPSGPERDAFRERWLGRYLRGGSDVVLVARVGEEVAGYLVGALDNPALQQRFADVDYFRTAFAELCRQFPAHLHVNLTAAYRNVGIGARLVEAFAQAARQAGAPGMHVITGRGMRNVVFYQRCGFVERGSVRRGDGEAVFLGRALEPDRS
jgi:GNAT superfamily N-acetyltransferase